MKFVVVLLVVVAGLWLLLRGRGARRDTPPKPPAPPAGRDASPAQMVACARCGLHLPQEDALRDGGGRPFCTAEHRDAGAT